MSVGSIHLSQAGPQVSRLALGMWRLMTWGLDDAGLLDLIHTAIDLGITTFDHADIYGDYRCEERFGRALAREPGLRHRLQLVTKCGIMPVSDRRPVHKVKHYDTGRAHILVSVDNSLRDLRSDHIDLLLIHRPDPLMDADEVAEAFHALRRSGKVLHFGVSNFTPWQFELLASRLDFALVTNQIEFSLLKIQVLHDGTLDQCQRLRFSPMAWSPLGGGRLFNGDDEQALRVRQALETVGEELGGASIDQVALAWVLRHPADIVPVLGTGNIEHLRRGAAAVDLSLSREQWFALWTASAGRGVP
jgi:predicted oxidoreductase